MSYSNFLAKTIKESEYSLRKIATLCEKKYNVKITASYLSKLQTGGQTPASAKVNEAIAKVCRINPDDLLFEAELERAPEMVKQLVNDLITFLKSFLISNVNNFPVNDEDIKSNMQEELNKLLNMSNREFVKSIFPEDSNFNPFDFSQLANGMPLTTDTTNKNIDDLFMKFSVGIKILDDSMFPLIKQGAKIELIKLDEYQTGDIVGVQLNNEQNIIRTYVDAGKDIILIPENKDFKPITINRKDINIIGKVKSYTIDL